jgi:glutamate-1-semialdehyde 2,1-aminomutase
MGHGACTLGHNRAEINAAMQKVFDLGFFAEFDHPLTSQLAEKMVEHIPCAESVRYVNSGSEATLLSMHLARGYTGKHKIVRIDGHYHGGHDYALSNNQAASADLSNPGDRLSQISKLSTGVPEMIGKTLHLIPWNNAKLFQNLARDKGHEIAAIIMTPIDFNNGCLTTTSEYLQTIRNICDRYRIVFILDEILSGFRTGISCAQGYYDVIPDLCLLGMALTNGVPLATIAGKEKVMQKIIDPLDPVFAGGTFSGNLMGCAAGIAAMEIMEQPGFFETWLSRVDTFLNEVQSIFDKESFPAIVQHLGCSFGIYVGTREPVRNYQDMVNKTNPEMRTAFFRKCIEKGLYFHTDFTVSAMHDEKTLNQAVKLVRKAVRETQTEMK